MSICQASAHNIIMMWATSCRRCTASSGTAYCALPAVALPVLTRGSLNTVSHRDQMALALQDCTPSGFHRAEPFEPNLVANQHGQAGHVHHNNLIVVSHNNTHSMNLGCSRPQHAPGFLYCKARTTQQLLCREPFPHRLKGCDDRSFRALTGQFFDTGVAYP